MGKGELPVLGQAPRKLLASEHMGTMVHPAHPSDPTPAPCTCVTLFPRYILLPQAPDPWGVLRQTRTARSGCWIIPDPLSVPVPARVQPRLPPSRGCWHLL